MKKLLFAIGLCLAAIAANAQNFTSTDILRVRALQIGTNGYGITNLANLVTNIGMLLNPTNVFYTNNAGTYVGYNSATSLTNYLAQFGTTNAVTSVGLFNDVPLYPDRNGNPIYTERHEILAGAAGATTNLSYLSHQTLFIEWVNPLGSNGAFGVVFRPLWDGKTPSTATAEDWGFNVAQATTTKGTLSTNIPVYKWPGAKALRVVVVTNFTTLAIPSNSTFITKLNVNGFVP